MTGADIRHLFGSANRLVIDLSTTDPLRDEALIRVADRRSVAAHRAVGKDVEHMLGRHLLQDGCSRGLMRGIRAFVTRRAIVEVLRNARTLRLYTGDNRPDHC